MSTLHTHEGLTFTPRELHAMACAWQCMQTQPKIDYEQFSRLTGYTLAGGKFTLWNLRRKMRDHVQLSTGPSVHLKISGQVTPKKPKSGKTGLEADSGAEKSATKKRASDRKAKGKKKEDDEEDEFKDVKVPKEEQMGLLRGVEGYLGQAYRGHDAREDFV